MPTKTYFSPNLKKEEDSGNPWPSLTGMGRRPRWIKEQRHIDIRRIDSVFMRKIEKETKTMILDLSPILFKTT